MLDQAPLGDVFGVSANPNEERRRCRRGVVSSEKFSSDNHIVLVDRVLRIKPGETAKETLSRREEDSITAEFAPRPRLDHLNVTRANLLPLIQVDGVQKVRVTGI